LPEVVDRFHRFQELHPDDAQACLLYAKALLAEMAPGEFPPDAEQAMQLLVHARSLDPNQADIHYQLGCLLERKREYAAAAAELERSAALDPRQPGVHFQLARVYEREGRKEDAARERDEHQKLAESIDAPPSNDASTSDDARIHNLIDEVAQSGRVLEAGSMGDRLGGQRQIAPGRPPLLEFRYLEGVKRHGFGSLDLVIDDAGH
jgi:tetratricopeptide (TPR) repeat protein